MFLACVSALIAMKLSQFFQQTRYEIYRCGHIIQKTPCFLQKTDSLGKITGEGTKFSVKHERTDIQYFGVPEQNQFKNFLIYFNFIFNSLQIILLQCVQSTIKLPSMYDRTLNQSRTSLTTNSSRSSKIVRKRDFNLSATLIRSKSRNREDQTNTSFEQYLTRQSRYFGLENAETVEQQNLQKSLKNEKQAKIQRSGSANLTLTLSQTLSSFQTKRVNIIQRSDRYIQPKITFQSEGICIEDKNEPKEKKRQPTPVKSKKQIAIAGKNIEVECPSSQIFELQLRIQGLEQIINIEKRQKQKINAQLLEVVRDRQNLREIVNQMEIQNKILLAQKKSLQQKILYLEKTVLQSQSNLTLAQNSLNKLRQAIKQNRISQLQAEIKNQAKINQNLKLSITQLQQQSLTLNDKISKLTKELEEQKKKGDVQALKKQHEIKQQYLVKQLQKMKKESQTYKFISLNEKQKVLEDIVQSQLKLIYTLQGEINSLMVKIHCMQQNKVKEISEIKEKNGSEMKALRVKYSKLVSEMKKNGGSKPNSAILEGANKNNLITNQISPTKNSPPSNYSISCKCQCSPSLLDLPYPSQNSQSHNYTCNSNKYDTRITIYSSSQNYNEKCNGNNLNRSTTAANNTYRPTTMANRALLPSNSSNDNCIFELSPE